MQRANRDKVNNYKTEQKIKAVEPSTRSRCWSSVAQYPGPPQGMYVVHSTLGTVHTMYSTLGTVPRVLCHSSWKATHTESELYLQGVQMFRRDTRNSLICEGN